MVKLSILFSICSLQKLTESDSLPLFTSASRECAAHTCIINTPVYILLTSPPQKKCIANVQHTCTEKPALEKYGTAEYGIYVGIYL